jgi:hypothetical protein
VLIPGTSTPSTTLIADYQGILGHFTLSVLSPDQGSFSLVTGSNIANVVNGNLANGYLKPPQTQAGTGTLWLGAGTSYPLMVVASLGGVVSDMTTFARWSFVGGGDSSIVSVSPTGILSGHNSGATQTLKADFPGCTTELTLPVAVANITDLRFQQDTSFAAQDLAVGNTEPLVVWADFAKDAQGNDIPSMDVSGVVNFWTSDSNVLNIVATGGTGASVTAAFAGGPVTLQATQNFGGQAQVQSPYLQISTVAATLNAIAVATPSSDAVAGLPQGCVSENPSQPSLKTGSICYAPFTATGTYVQTDGSTFTQDVTRLATWSLSDPTLASIASGGQNSGWITAPVVEPQSVETVTATIPGSATDLTASTLLQLQ